VVLEAGVSGVLINTYVTLITSFMGEVMLTLRSGATISSGCKMLTVQGVSTAGNMFGSYDKVQLVVCLGDELDDLDSSDERLARRSSPSTISTA
jgi:hypothetical protein